MAFILIILLIEHHRSLTEHRIKMRYFPQLNVLILLMEYWKILQRLCRVYKKICVDDKKCNWHFFYNTHKQLYLPVIHEVMNKN
jgi:hypothetical protein